MILPIIKTNGTTSTTASKTNNVVPSASSAAAAAALEATSKMFYNNYYQQSTNGFSVQNLLNNSVGQQQHFDNPIGSTMVNMQQADAWPQSSSPSAAYEYRTQFTKLFQQNNLFLNQGHHMMASPGVDPTVDSQQFHNPYLLNGDSKGSLINNENNYHLQQQNDYFQHNGK